MTRKTGSRQSRLIILLLCSGLASPTWAQDDAGHGQDDTTAPIVAQTPLLGQVLGENQLAPAVVNDAQTPNGNPRGTSSLAANPLVTLGFSSGIFYEDDDGDVDGFLGLGLNAGVFSETRSQRFSLTAATRAEIDGTEVAFANTLFDLSYAYFTRQTELSFNLGFSEFDVDNINTTLGDAFDDDDLSTDDGTRQVADARVRLITGRTTRFSTNTTLGFRLQEFTGTTDPDLTGTTSYDVGTTLTFVIDPRLTVRGFATIVQTDDDNALNTLETDTRFGANGLLQIDQAWSAFAELAFTQEREEFDGGGGRIETEDAGFDFALDVTRAMRNGNLAFSYSRDQSEDDQIDTLSVTRELGLANGAQLSASAGVISFETGDVLPLLGLTYQHEFLRGHVIALSLSQSGAQNEDDEDILRSLANARYTHQLTRNSQIAVFGTLASVNPLEGITEDSLNVSFGVSYAHDLTDDWAVVARADRRISFDDGIRTDETDEVSINLERTFSFRP